MTTSGVFGRLDDGTEVRRHVLGGPGLSLEVLEYGARVHRLLVDGADGRRRNVVLGHPDLADYVSSPAFFGATVGRYANRIRGGRFDLDGREVRLGTNENGNTLHGGPDGFDKRVWQTSDLTDTSALFTLVSPDGDQGFPGAVTASVRYTIDGDTVVIDSDATTDRTTVLSLTNHTYVNLDGEGAGSVDDHVLAVSADHYTPADAESLPTGRIEEVAGTPFDLRDGRRLGDVVRRDHPGLRAAMGLDHNFVISGRGLRRAATLHSPRSGLTLRTETDRPGLQVYTGNQLDGTLVGTGGGLYRQGDGIALEPQAFPDSPNHPDFPSTVLRPGETYRSTTRWQFAADAADQTRV